MKNPLIYYVLLTCIIAFSGTSLSAQKATASKTETQKTNKRSENYQKLLEMGYSDQEIFEDLGNANFLSENYETALFWYRKLKTVSQNGKLSKSYHERYQYALQKTGAKEIAFTTEEKDWLASVKADYRIKGNIAKSDYASSKDSRFKELYIHQRDESLMSLVQSNNADSPMMEQAPITITEDGKTAFFSKASYVKPAYGIFSKKELVHKIYRADKVNGQWKNIKQVSLCPKNYSTLHPTVSRDGKRLFFASNMPGTFGEYDIYVSNINKDGSLGVAKNLGTKVNTKKNDLYPNLVGNNTLFFASEGRKGYGGLDLYMVDVDSRKVGIAMNLGSPINSAEDDLAIQFSTENGMGYVMSNRGRNTDNIHQVAFSYAKKNNLDDRREFDIADAFTNDVKIDYSSTIFDDE